MRRGAGSSFPGCAVPVKLPHGNSISFPFQKAASVPSTTVTLTFINTSALRSNPWQTPKQSMPLRTQYKSPFPFRFLLFTDASLCSELQKQLPAAVFPQHQAQDHCTTFKKPIAKSRTWYALPKSVFIGEGAAAASCTESHKLSFQSENTSEPQEKRSQQWTLST